MRYATPSIRTVAVDDVLSKLGPARAMVYGDLGGGSKPAGDCRDSVTSRSGRGGGSR